MYPWLWFWQSCSQELFISSNPSICFTKVCPSLRTSDHVVVSISIGFPQKRVPLFIALAYDYSRVERNGLSDHLGDVSWENIFKFGASAAAATEFSERVQAEIDVFIHLWKYQVKFYSSPWFSIACASVVVHRNKFFR